MDHLEQIAVQELVEPVVSVLQDINASIRELVEAMSEIAYPGDKQDADEAVADRVELSEEVADQIAEMFSALCEYSAGIEHKCTALVAAHDISRMVRGIVWTP